MVRSMIASLVVAVCSVATVSGQTASLSYTSVCVNAGVGLNKVVTASRIVSNDGIPIGARAGLVGWNVAGCSAGFPNSGWCELYGYYDIKATGERTTNANGNFTTWHHWFYGPQNTQIGNYSKTATCPTLQPCAIPGCLPTPILIPTANLAKHGRPFTVSSAAHGVDFDLNADGAPERLGWPEKHVAFLAHDVNGNGIIDDGRELFGTANGHPSGFAKLYALASVVNGEARGSVDVTHPLWPSLLLWEDKNRNGFSEPSELRPASDILTQIGLGWEGPTSTPDANGNDFLYQGWAEYRLSGPKTNPNTFVYPIYDVVLHTP